MEPVVDDAIEGLLTRLCCIPDESHALYPMAGWVSILARRMVVAVNILAEAAEGRTFSEEVTEVPETDDASLVSLPRRCGGKVDVSRDCLPI